MYSFLMIKKMLEEAIRSHGGIGVDDKFVLACPKYVDNEPYLIKIWY